MIADELPPRSRIVVLLPDTGRNYLSQFYDDDWFERHFPPQGCVAPRRVARVSSNGAQRKIEPGRQDARVSDRHCARAPPSTTSSLPVT